MGEHSRPGWDLEGKSVLSVVTERAVLSTSIVAKMQVTDRQNTEVLKPKETVRVLAQRDQDKYPHLDYMAGE